MKLFEIGLFFRGIMGSTQLDWADNATAASTVKELRDVIYGRKLNMALTTDAFIQAKQNGAAIVHIKS